MNADEIKPHSDAQALLDFWFVDHTEKDWYGGKSEFDAKVSQRFLLTLKRAERCELFEWRDTPKGRLAEIIILDQFSRQLYRGSSDAFKNDAMALSLAQEAVAGGHDMSLDQVEQEFLLMPYMHSESAVVHLEALNLFRKLSEKSYEYEQKHYEVIKRFGRYPMRNEALGRTSTPDEVAYIAERDGRMF
ncbi:MAG: DUF924 family protein [Pseudomonadota bacterium]